MFNELLNKRAHEFDNLKDEINPNKLIYKFKNERNSSKDIRDYQKLLQLFENLRDGDERPKEVLKNQIEFKLDLTETKKGNPKFKSEEQITAI